MMHRSANLPTSIEPSLSETLSARAPLIVAIFNTSAGLIPALVIACISRWAAKPAMYSPQLT